MDVQVRPVGYERMNPGERVALSEKRLVAADFSDRKLRKFSSDRCRFERCRFDGAAIQGAAFGAGQGMSEYIECSFNGADLNLGPGGFARFVDCAFEETTIQNWFCFAVELVNCSFSGRLKKVFFNGTVPDDDRPHVGRARNQFEGNDFSTAKFLDVGFRTGVDLTNQKLPIGDEYTYIEDAVAAINRARAAYDRWSPALQKERGGFLSLLEEDVSRGQHQLLVRPDDYSKNRRPAIRAVLAAAQGA